MHIECNNITFGFPRQDALFKDLSFVAEAGILTALVGPSGSGKSTLLNILGSIEKKYLGEIYLHGAKGAREVRRQDAAWILQSNTVLGGRRVIENVAVGATADGNSWPISLEMAAEALTRLGIFDLSERSIDGLSGGEVQRVTVARCLIARSPIVLADEPTGSLDKLSSRVVFDSLKNAAGMGKIVVLATHDSRLVNMCDQIIEI